MTYACQQNLIDRFGEDELIQLTDRASLGAIDATVVARALADADAEINGYLSTRYTLPLSSVPEILVVIACNIARYRLDNRDPREDIVTRYKDAIKYLKDVVAGEASLGVDSNNAQPDTATNSVQISSTTPVFRRSESDGFL